MNWSAWSTTFAVIRKGNDGLVPYRLREIPGSALSHHEDAIAKESLAVIRVSPTVAL